MIKQELKKLNKDCEIRDSILKHIEDNQRLSSKYGKEYRYTDLDIVSHIMATYNLTRKKGK